MNLVFLDITALKKGHFNYFLLGHTPHFIIEKTYTNKTVDNSNLHHWKAVFDDSFPPMAGGLA